MATRSTPTSKENDMVAIVGRDTRTGAEIGRMDLGEGSAFSALSAEVRATLKAHFDYDLCTFDVED